MTGATGPPARTHLPVPGAGTAGERRQTGVDAGCRGCWDDPCTCRVARVDALITLSPVWSPRMVPADPRDQLETGGTLEIVSVFDFPGELDAAVDEALAGWVEHFKRTGEVPDTGLDFRNRPGIAVVRRAGRRSWRCRCDAFEVETETGSTTGACVLTWRLA